MEDNRTYRNLILYPLSLIFTGLTFLGPGCREQKTIESYVKEDINLPAIKKSYQAAKTSQLPDERTLEAICDKEPNLSQKPPEMTFDRFKKEKLGDRYNKLSDERKRFFDRVYSPHDWKLLDDIYYNPESFIENMSKVLESPDYLTRYRNFKEKALKDLSDESKKSVKKIVPVIDLDKPAEFDIATAFYILELEKQFSVFEVKRKNK